MYNNHASSFTTDTYSDDDIKTQVKLEGKVKRRASRAGTRSVSTLTSAQLERKRANDREAQRAIRQRTKEHIDRLEAQIAELSARDARLKPTLERNATLEAEVALLRNQLGPNFNALSYNVDDDPRMEHGGLITSNGHHIPPKLAVTPLGAYAQYDSRDAQILISRPPPGTDSAPLSSAGSLPSDGGCWQDYNDMPHSATSGRSIHPDSADFNQWSNDEARASQMLSNNTLSAEGSIPATINFGFLLDASGQPVNFLPPTNNQEQYHQQQQNEKAQIPYSASLPTGTFGPATAPENPFISTPAKTNDGIPILPRHSAPVDPNPAPASFVNFMNQPSTYAWEIPIRAVPPTCPVDTILLTFMHGQRSLAVEGVSQQQLEGPEYPSISSLIDPSRSVMSHPISKVLTDLLGSLPDLVSIPEKTATLFMMYLLLRWQISPTPQTYDSIPSFLTPRATQLVTPHPIWIDQMPWPKLRDRVISNQPLYATLEFQLLFTSSLSVNWPYRQMDALIFQNDEVVMNPVFERHINVLGNWSLGEKFSRRYPELDDACRFEPGLGEGGNKAAGSAGVANNGATGEVNGATSASINVGASMAASMGKGVEPGMGIHSVGKVG